MVLAISDDGLVYVTDWGGGRISVSSAKGESVDTLAERGQSPGELSNPTGIKIGPG